MRSKLSTEGKLVTSGILCGTGSQVIKPTSYGVLKEIARTLKDNPTLNVRIRGIQITRTMRKATLPSQSKGRSRQRGLNQNLGHFSQQLTTEGKGQILPVADNQQLGKPLRQHAY